MFNHSELNHLLAAMRANGVTTLEVKHSGQRLRLVLPSFASRPAALKGLPKAEWDTAKSPTIGTFLRCGIDDGLRPLEPGMHVATGDILGYVCHGPVRSIVNAPVSGVISDQGPQDGAALGVGDTVFNLQVTS